MYLLKDITPSGGGDRIILRLVGDSEQALITVPPEAIAKYDLKKGCRVSRELYAELTEDSELDGAMRKGLAILGYGSNSKARLEEKLTRHGYSRDTAHRAVLELEGRGYIDEEKDALRLCDSMISKKYGPRKILMSLRTRGYGREVLQKADEFLGEIDFTEVCAALIKVKVKKIPENREEMKKLLAKLTALGYNVGEVRKALELLRDEA